jgi:hypothetical protein
LLLQRVPEVDPTFAAGFLLDVVASRNRKQLALLQKIRTMPMPLIDTWKALFDDLWFVLEFRQISVHVENCSDRHYEYSVVESVHWVQKQHIQTQSVYKEVPRTDPSSSNQLVTQIAPMHTSLPFDCQYLSQFLWKIRLSLL